MSDKNIKLILGSQSVSRYQVLTQHGYTFVQIVPDINEKAFGDSRNAKPDPAEIALTVANAKADAILLRIKGDVLYNEYLLLTSDQVVYYNGEIREKPESEQVFQLYIYRYLTKN